MEEITATIAQLLEEMGIDGPPVDVYAVAAYLGLLVVPLDAAFCAACNLDPRAIKWLDGLLLWGHDCLCIAVNTMQSETRQRFSIAHEIAHYLCGHGHQTKPSPQMRTRRRDRYDPEERLMNRAAAHIIMPEPLVRAAVDAGDRSHQAFLELCSRFCVSKRAMAIRLDYLDILVGRSERRAEARLSPRSVR